MSFSKTVFLGVAALSLCACQTTSVAPTPSEMLLAGVETGASSQDGFTKRLSSSDPACVTFYKNTTEFVSLPSDLGAGGPAAPSFGQTLTRTLILGTLAGVASGGVAAIGIGNSFAEAALIGTASQVTFSAGGTIYDSIVTPEAEPVLDVPADTPFNPMQEIQKAANIVGCPAPDEAAIAALKLGEADK